jgi:hypothetical protein
MYKQYINPDISMLDYNYLKVMLLNLDLGYFTNTEITKATIYYLHKERHFKMLDISEWLGVSLRNCHRFKSFKVETKQKYYSGVLITLLINSFDYGGFVESCRNIDFIKLMVS